MPRDLPVVEVDVPLLRATHPAPLGRTEAAGTAAVLKALAEPNRLRLLSILLAKADLTACTCELTGPLGLGQPTVSHHLRRLHEAGLVDAERRGLWTVLPGQADALAALAVSAHPRAEEPTPAG